MIVLEEEAKGDVDVRVFEAEPMSSIMVAMMICFTGLSWYLKFSGACFRLVFVHSMPSCVSILSMQSKLLPQL